MKISLASLLFLPALLALTFQSCGQEPADDPVVTIGTTLKLTYDSDILMIGDIDYAWSFQKKPVNSYSVLLCSRGKALFTPDVPGEYEISVFVNNEGVVNDTKNYFFTAVGEGKPAQTIPQQSQDELVEAVEIPAISKQSTRTPEEPEPLADVPPHEAAPYTAADTTTVAYTIQVHSHSSEAAAAEDRDKLVEMGYPAYIQPFRSAATDMTWYRVRVGSFNSLEAADTVKKTLSEILNSNDMWIDAVRKHG